MSLNRKKIFQGRIFTVQTEKKKLPGGKEAYFEEVIHPGASVVVPCFGNKIILIRQWRGVIGKFIWELPAGTLEKNETPYKCAVREVREETGYKIRRMKKIGYIYTTPGFCDEKIHVFMAECHGKQEKSHEADEVIKVWMLTRKKVAGLFAEGKIVDSKTISALSLAGVL